MKDKKINRVATARYAHGFVLGKFMPLHAGHVYLLQTAQTNSKKLTIMLFSQPDDPIPSKVRIGWLKHEFPQADMIHHDKTLPRDVSGVGFWDQWLESIISHLGGRQIDVVFSSENYGPRLAKDLNCDHVEIDLARSKFPISATDIRKNPQAFREFIPDVVRPYFGV